MIKTKDLLIVATGGALLLMAVIIGLAMFILNPAGKLSIDVNPSIELTFNRLNNVIEVQAMNQEGKDILAAANLKGLKLDKAVREIVFTFIDKGYLSKEDTIILLSSKDNSFSKDALKRIQNQTVVWLKDYYKSTNLASQVVDLSPAEMELAEKLGISFGRYSLIKEIAINDLGITEEQLLGMTVGELIQFAKEQNLKLDKVTYFDHDDLEDLLEDLLEDDDLFDDLFDDLDDDMDDDDDDGDLEDDDDDLHDDDDDDDLENDDDNLYDDDDDGDLEDDDDDLHDDDDDGDLEDDDDDDDDGDDD